MAQIAIPGLPLSMDESLIDEVSRDQISQHFENQAAQALAARRDRKLAIRELIAGELVKALGEPRKSRVKSKLETGLVEALKGGPGSGHWGHAGRPGKRGGSALDEENPDKLSEEIGEMRKKWSNNPAYKREIDRKMNHLVNLESKEHRQALARIKPLRAGPMGDPEYQKLDAQAAKDSKQFASLYKQKISATLEVDRLNREYGMMMQRLGEKQKEQSRLSQDIQDAEIRVTVFSSERKRKAYIAEQNRLLEDVNQEIEDIQNRFTDTQDAQGNHVESPWKKEVGTANLTVRSSDQGLQDLQDEIAIDGRYDRALEIGMKHAERVRKAIVTSPVSRGIERLRNEAMTIGQEKDDLEKKIGYNFKNNLEWIHLAQKENAVMVELSILEGKQRMIASRYTSQELGNGNSTQNPGIELKQGRDFYYPEFMNEGRSILGELYEMTGNQPGFRESGPVMVDSINKGTYRAHTEIDGSGIAVSQEFKTSRSTWVHEMGHVLEARNPVIRALAHKFLNKRTAGETEERLMDLQPGLAYDPWEMTKKDKFPSPYSGKQYFLDSDKKHRYATEILSMGLQYFYQDPFKFAVDDPEYFDFIYAVVRIGSHG